MQPLAQQIAAFLLIIILGMVMGLFYDSYRVFRNLWRPKARGTFFGDAVFWLVVTVLAFLFLIFSTWGEVRVYVFLAIGFGAWLYFKIFSSYMRFVFLGLFSLLARLFWCVIRVLKVPIMFCWLIILLPFRFLVVFILSVYKGLKKTGAALRFKTPPPGPPQN